MIKLNQQEIGQFQETFSLNTGKLQHF